MPEITAKHEIVLYRCGCAHCDSAEEELSRLAKLYQASFSVRRVKNEGVYAGSATPMVYINGVKISHYALSAKKWEKALAVPLERKKLRGEIVDVSCYEKKGARGAGHRECAELCILEIKLPMGLLTPEGGLYRIAVGPESGVIYEELKRRIGRQVEVAGDVYQWEDKSTLTVREIE